MLGHGHREQQVDRLTIGRAKIDRLIQLHKTPRRRGERIAAPMRNRDTVTERGGAEFFSGAQALKDPPFAIVALSTDKLAIGKQTGEQLKQSLLAGDFGARDNAGGA